jgi:hypothetical protein
MGPCWVAVVCAVQVLHTRRLTTVAWVVLWSCRSHWLLLLLLLFTAWIHRPTNATTPTSGTDTQNLVPHTPALTHMLCRTKHVLAGPGVSRFNPCFDHQMPREAIILTHALTLLNHQLVRYACGMGASNQPSRAWGHTLSTTGGQYQSINGRAPVSLRRCCS